MKKKEEGVSVFSVLGSVVVSGTGSAVASGSCPAAETFSSVAPAACMPARSVISVTASVTDPEENVSVALLMTSGTESPLFTMASAHSAAVSSFR